MVNIIQITLYYYYYFTSHSFLYIYISSIYIYLHSILIFLSLVKFWGQSLETFAYNSRSLPARACVCLWPLGGNWKSLKGLNLHSIPHPCYLPPLTLFLPLPCCPCLLPASLLSYLPCQAISFTFTSPAFPASHNTLGPHSNIPCLPKPLRSLRLAEVTPFLTKLQSLPRAAQVSLTTTTTITTTLCYFHALYTSQSLIPKPLNCHTYPTHSPSQSPTYPQ